MAEKSAQYPKVTWETCMEFIEKVSSFSLRAVSYSEVAKVYGLNNPTAKSFTAKVSTCKQFGLIATSGGNTIQLTERSKRLLFPTGEDTSIVAKECFGMPVLYSKLIAIYDGKALPNANLLSNILMKDHQIQKSVKDSAAKVFIESAEQLGLIKGGILCYSDDEEERYDSTFSQPVEESNSILPGAQTLVKGVADAVGSITGKNFSAEADYITQAIPFESGKIARITIPIDATEDDLLLLHDMFNIILKRKYKLDI